MLGKGPLYYIVLHYSAFSTFLTTRYKDWDRRLGQCKKGCLQLQQHRSYTDLRSLQIAFPLSRFWLSLCILVLTHESCTQVEDMLKRSFAEFHAQKAQPESLEALEKGQAALSRVRAQPFPKAMLGTSKEDIMDYHNITRDIEDLSQDLQVCTVSSGAQI